MDKIEPIQIYPDCVWHGLLEQAKHSRLTVAEPRKSRRRRKKHLIQKPIPTVFPTIPDVARKFSLKAGGKDVRQVGLGKIPDPGQRVELNGWLVMRATDYPGIVPQEGLDQAIIYLDEGAQIKEFLIADDLRKYKPSQIHQVALHAVERVRSIDWLKGKNELIQGTRVLASVLSAIVTPIFIGMKRKAKEINWGEVRKVLGKGLRVSALAIACIAGAFVALPIIALAAIPVSLFSFDPLLIAVDSENRFWVIYEWDD